jgi:tRNA pseudouridine38-40 synthase
MGALIQLGRGLLSLDEIERSLTEDTDIKISYIAPGSGLVLDKLEFE